MGRKVFATLCACVPDFFLRFLHVALLIRASRKKNQLEKREKMATLNEKKKFSPIENESFTGMCKSSSTSMSSMCWLILYIVDSVFGTNTNIFKNKNLKRKNKEKTIEINWNQLKRTLHQQYVTNTEMWLRDSRMQFYRVLMKFFTLTRFTGYIDAVCRFIDCVCVGRFICR